MTPTPETRKIGERTYTNDGERRMCWSCYLVATTWQNEFGTAWCEHCQGKSAIAALAVSEQARQRAESKLSAMRYEVDENLLTAIVEKRKRGAESAVNPTPDSADYWQGKADALRLLHAFLAPDKESAP